MRPLILVLIGLWMAAPALGQVVPDTLRPPPAVADSLVAFGWTVDADDDFLLVGAWEVRPSALGLQSDPKGTAFVYRLTDDGPVLDGRLLSDRLYLQDCFSWGGLDVRDSIAAVGARCDYDGTSFGAVYLYRRDAGGWYRETKIRSADVIGPRRPRTFGDALALGEDVLVVGAAYTPNPTDGTEDQSGVVLVYEWNGTDWVQAQVLTGADDDALRNERFGSAVALVGEPGAEVLLVGAELEVGPDPLVRGALYVFERTDGQWVQQAKLYCAGSASSSPSECGVRIRAGGGGAVVASSGALQPLDRVNGVWQLGPPLPTPGGGFPIGVDRYGDEMMAVGYTPSAGAPMLSYTRNGAGIWTATAGSDVPVLVYADPFVSLNTRHAFVGVHYPNSMSPTHNLVLIYPRAGTVATSPVPPAPLDGLAVRVGPNPTTGVATVRIDLPTDGPVTVDVVDLQGRVVWRGGTATAPAGEHTRQVDLRGVAAGTYVVRVTTATHSGRAVLVTQ